MDLLVEEINEGLVQGYHLRANQKSQNGAIIIFGGSEGGCNYEKAEILAAHGFEVLALFIFGKPNLPKELKEVPLEIFVEAMAIIKQTFQSPTPLIVIGESKGAELALLLGSIYSEEIDKIVGIVPSSYVFYGLGNMDHEASSWSRNGVPIPYVSLMRLRKSFHFSTVFPFATYLFKTIRKKPVSFRRLYELCVKLSDQQEDARIKIEDFKGDLLLIAGEQDLLWPSDQMVKEIQKSRQPLPTEVIIYEKAGHAIGGPYATRTLILGGDEESSKVCFQSMMAAIKSFCLNNVQSVSGE